MTVLINGMERETKAATLMQLAEELGLPEKGVAVAVENRIVPRGEWPDTQLSSRAITIIKAAFGG